MDFGLGVAQTAIGAALGFGLGLVGFHYQHKREREAAELAAQKAAVEALNRAVQSVAVNIDTLVGIKRQVIKSLRPEAEAVQLALEKCTMAEPEQKEELARRVLFLFKDSGQLYQSHPSITAMALPDIKEFSLFNPDMPSLTTFMFLAMSQMTELDARASSRNILISEFARESAGGMNEKRAFYFASMISSESKAMCEAVDYSLGFCQLVMDQITDYMNAKHKDKPILQYFIRTDVITDLPDSKVFQSYQDQIVKF
jgi:ribosomal protein S11